MGKIKTWQTGGETYYMTFVVKRGLHELRRVTDEESGEFELVKAGHFQQCESEMQVIISGNVDCDHNL